MDRIAADFRHALRSLAAHRGYAVTAVLTFALGIGANVAVFNLANWLLLRPLPGVRDEARLVTVSFGSMDDAVYRRSNIPVVDFQALERGIPALSLVAGYTTVQIHVAAGHATPRRADEDVVTGRYFDILGMRMTMGRGFTPAEGVDPSLPPVAVISDRLWRSDLGADPGILGHTLTVNRQPVTIVGVAARGFHGASLNASSDVWMPVAQYRIAMPGQSPKLLTWRGSGTFSSLVGRLAPGASRETVDAQADAVRAQLALANPADKDLHEWHRFYRVTPGVESLPRQRTKLNDSVTMLIGMASLLLLLTCANVGNLMVARAIARRSEIATRLALGASRAAVARLLLAESLLLSTGACVAAVAFAWIIARAFGGTVVLQGLAPLERAEMDWRVLGYAMLISTVVAMVAGAFPALSIAHVDVNSELRESGRSVTPGRQQLRRLLTAAQVAVSLTLLIGAGLLVRSMNARLGVSPGFDATRVMTFSVNPGLQGYGDRPPSFGGDLLDRVRRVPGVRTAALSAYPPFLQGAAPAIDFFAEGTDGKPMWSADANAVSPGFFDALGLQLIDGREFTEAEFQSTSDFDDSLVIMTESLARKAFGSGSAVGRHVEYAGRTGPKTVVGVVRDTKQRRLTDPSSDMIFWPINQGHDQFSVIVGLAAPESKVVPGLRQALADVDPTLPMYDVIRVDEAIRGEFADDYLVMRLTMAFAVLATLVAAVGLYGVLARGVTERRREFGVRVALGASPSAIAGLVTREALYVLIGGVGLGVGASLWLARLLDSRLFGVSHLDAVAFAAAIGLIVVVMLASAAPAGRRAAKMNAAEVMK